MPILTEHIQAEPIPKQYNTWHHQPATTAGETSIPIKPWKNYERILFRITFIFFILMCSPSSAQWYLHIINTDWARPHYRDLYYVGRFESGVTFWGSTLFGNPLGGYATWVITLLVAIAGRLAWTFVVHKTPTERKEYNILYYWLRVVVRYRASIGIITFGFVKLLPQQMPYPSLGQLNTHFGDFTAQKIYLLSVGISPWYQVFGGAVEILSGIMLLFRRTTFAGAVLLMAALGTILFINLGYDGGVHVYSSYFVLLALFLLVKNVPYIYRLFIQEKFTVPVYVYPPLKKHWQRYTRVALKTFIIVIFLGLLFYLQLVNFLYDPYKQPSIAGVPTLQGNYRVTEFRINGTLLPYSPLDTVRWQEVTFEKWTTLTFQVNKPITLDLSNGDKLQQDLHRMVELSGTGGGLRVFHYSADTVNQVLYLQDKNVFTALQRGRTKDSSTLYSPDWIPPQALANIGNEVNKIDPRAASARREREFAAARGYERRNRMILHYKDTQHGARVVLSGIDENLDSIYVVFDRINRPYILKEPSLQGGRY